MVGCALGTSRLWFTLGFGIVNEVYYPRVDIPQIRDLGFIVADGDGFWAEVKRIDNYQMRLLAPGVPAVEIVHRHERYSLLLRVSPGSRRDILVIECRLDGDDKLKVYALLAPHLGATGYANTATVVSHHGRVTLCAEQGHLAPRSPRSTHTSAMPSDGQAPAMSEPATAGRISRETVG
jgi:glucoamylase